MKWSEHVRMRNYESIENRMLEMKLLGKMKRKEVVSGCEEGKHVGDLDDRRRKRHE